MGASEVLERGVWLLDRHPKELPTQVQRGYLEEATQHGAENIH